MEQRVSGDAQQQVMRLEREGDDHPEFIGSYSLGTGEQTQKQKSLRLNFKEALSGSSVQPVPRAARTDWKHQK